MRPTPSARFAAELGEGRADAAQLTALARLDALALTLQQRPAPSPIRRLGERLGLTPPAPPVRGLYLWGSVGRGKTALMDAFHGVLPPGSSTRLHFHRFMGEVHRELASLKQHQDPLRLVAAKLARRARVLCFDEFAVSDIGDAMLLGTLFEHAFAAGVTLVATSNMPPRDLYRDGLQRARFLPAIALLEQHCEVLEVDGGTDYRLRALSRAELYHAPLDAGADESLARSFRSISGQTGAADQTLQIEGRRIATRRLADGVAWFEFAELCEGPRSAADYIEIARLHHSVLISGVPEFHAGRDDAARRFISLVDEFYDRGVKLVLSAEVPLPALYAGKRLAFEFQRTVSRLQEMQTHAYLARAHLP